MKEVEISFIQPADYRNLSDMVGELLNEIMDKTQVKTLHYNPLETEERAKALITSGIYWVFIAKDKKSKESLGFVSLYESYALYAEGAFGTIPELYVRSGWRSQNIGRFLLERAKAFALRKNWKRIEVTTPPLPSFDKTLSFYQKQGFDFSGGRKLKIDVNI